MLLIKNYFIVDPDEEREDISLSSRYIYRYRT